VAARSRRAFGLYLQPPVGNRTLVLGARSGAYPGAGFGRYGEWNGHGFRSGTDALAAAVLAACEASPRLEPAVAVSVYTCPDAIAAILAAGATPVLIDLEPQSLRMCLDGLRRCVDDNPNLVAIIGTDLFGFSERWPELRQLVGERSIALIQDAAQSLQDEGCYPRELHGDITIFSFGRGKPVYLGGGGLALVRVGSAVEPFLAKIHRRAAEAQIGLIGSLLRRSFYNAALSPLLYPWIARALGARIGRTRYAELAEIAAVPVAAASLFDAGLDRFWQSQRDCQASVVEMLERVAASAEARVEFIGGFHRSDAYRRRRLIRCPMLVRHGVERSRLIASLLRCGVAATPMYGAILPAIERIPSGLKSQRNRFPNGSDVASRLITLPVHEGIRPSDLREVETTLTSEAV